MATMQMRRMFAKFKPYEWEMSTQDIAASTGLKPSNIVRMDTNTSPFFPVRPMRLVAKMLSSLSLRVNDYPDTSYFGLRKGLSTYCNLDIDRFVITDGADEALDIISKTLIDPGDETIIPYPSYSMFRITTELMGSRTCLVSRKKRSFEIDLQEIRKRISPKTRLIFLCSPNNPTGNSTSVDEVKSLLDYVGARTTVVIDEAYYEFSGRTMASLTSKHDNLVVIRTFSKAFSMAGVRVGYIIGSDEAVKKFHMVRPPNSLSVISLALAQLALKDRKSMQANVNSLTMERERCFKILSQHPRLEVFPSDANFLLFKVKDENRKISSSSTGRIANLLHKKLMSRGFILRNFSESPGIQSCLRVTINTPETNTAFLDTLSSLL